MDSFTQVVLGAAVGNHILGRKIGNKAILLGAIGGTIPDLDVYVGDLFDEVTANEIHRGFSHSIVFFVLMSLLLVGLSRFLFKKEQISSSKWFVFWYMILFTHALLDVFTTWGTQLLWPLEKRFSIESIFVIDPLYTLPFLFCLLMSMRISRDNHKRMHWNLLGLGWSLLYLLISFATQQYMVRKFISSFQDKNIQAVDVIVKPAPFILLMWNANIKTQDAYWLADYSVFDTQEIRWKKYESNVELLHDISEAKVIRQLKHLSEGWFVITKSDEKMFFNDLRFGVMQDKGKEVEFAFSYEIHQKDGVVSAVPVANKTRERASELLKDWWTRLKGN